MLKVIPALVALAVAPLSAQAPAAKPPVKAKAPDAVARGKYLVVFGGCSDCHTPKALLPNGIGLDSSRLLSGHPATSVVNPPPMGLLSPDGWIAATNLHLTAWVGPWGVTYAANLTPDPTGLGSWTDSVFIRAMRTGKHMGVGRDILPPMPWMALGALTDEDLKAIFAYLRTIKPVENVVPAAMTPSLR
jgi:mono/diheme cytochrome c family protein